MKRFLFVTAIVFILSFSTFGQKAAAGRVDPQAGQRPLYLDAARPAGVAQD